MLKNIPDIISPQLMKCLMEMGHSDTIVIADGNFPVHTMNNRVIDAYGHSVNDILEAILQFFPLDPYVDHPVNLMRVVEGDPTVPVVWEDFRKTIRDGGYDDKKVVEQIDRFDFYDKAKDAYLVIATTDRALYANVLLQKGVC